MDVIEKSNLFETELFIRSKIEAKIHMNDSSFIDI